MKSNKKQIDLRKEKAYRAGAQVSKSTSWTFRKSLTSVASRSPRARMTHRWPPASRLMSAIWCGCEHRGVRRTFVSMWAAALLSAVLS